MKYILVFMLLLKICIFATVSFEEEIGKIEIAEYDSLAKIYYLDEDYQKVFEILETNYNIIKKNQQLLKILGHSALIVDKKEVAKKVFGDMIKNEDSLKVAKIIREILDKVYFKDIKGKNDMLKYLREVSNNVDALKTYYSLEKVKNKFWNIYGEIEYGIDDNINNGTFNKTLSDLGDIETPKIYKPLSDSYINFKLKGEYNLILLNNFKIVPNLNFNYQKYNSNNDYSNSLISFLVDSLFIVNEKFITGFPLSYSVKLKNGEKLESIIGLNAKMQYGFSEILNFIPAFDFKIVDSSIYKGSEISIIFTNQSILGKAKVTEGILYSTKKYDKEENNMDSLGGFLDFYYNFFDILNCSATYELNFDKYKKEDENYKKIREDTLNKIVLNLDRNILDFLNISLKYSYTKSISNIKFYEFSKGIGTINIKLKL